MALNWLTFLLAALATLPAQALEQKRLDAYAREVWTTRDGLPHNQVNAIAQTPEGYLWFATWEGVVRYNGQEFRSFGRNNVPALRDSGVRSVSVGPSGALVVATSRGGVSVLRGETWTTHTKADGLAQDETFAAREDRAGRIWVGTENQGVTRLESTGEAMQFNEDSGLPSNVTYALAEDGAGAIWVGTGKGVARIEGDRIQAFHTAEGLPSGAVFSLAVAPDGQLYAGTEFGVFVGRSGRFEPISDDIPAVAIASLQVDPQGSLWIGTVNKGLMRLGQRGLERFDVADGLPNNRVAALFADREGSLWAGTNAGLIRFADTPFITIDKHQGLADDYVRALLQTRSGEILVGSSRGLDRWQDEKITNSEGLEGESVLSLAQDQTGDIWIGTYSTGLLRWRDGAVQERITAPGVLPSNQVRAIHQSRDGSLWIGTARGLLHRKQGQDRVLGEKQGLPRDFVLSLFESRDGSLWVGTTNGAARIAKGEITALDLAAMDGAQDVFGMHEDEDGTLWFATDRGLVRLRNGEMSIVGGVQGLPVDAVFQVVVDSYGNFWLTSNAGVVYVRRDDMEAAANGGGERLDYQQFAEADGMGSAQCNGSSGPAALRATDGSIWVATAKGISVVQPDQLPRYQLAPPPVVIEGLRVDDRNASAAGNLVLPPGTRKLELDYVSLSYRTPEQIRYRYRLEGFDNGWVERNQRRNAQYTNLPPGQYRFQVSAAQRGSGWSPETASVNFEIQPRLYQRAWFLPAAGSLLALFLYLLYRARVGQLKAREALLSRIVDDRTRDLSEKNGELELKNETIRKQSEIFEQLSRTDALTGLPNRRSMDEGLARAYAEALQAEAPLCFGLLDIDHFKRVNDGYSHDVGDEALRQVARVLREVMGREQAGRWRGDERVARWGGEEFALLFPQSDLVQARDQAERLRSAIEAIDCRSFAPGLKITASIGLAERSGLANHERLVSRADERLYEAKNSGRNRVAG
ncbi:MAG: diguanylate cyclase [Arenimonas sp.]|nr:diguanylate cyclase [Arenimonas sp.]